MAVYISLIRGINVGGHKSVKMDALRALYHSLGLKGAQTLLQSGNVVFESENPEPLDLARQIAAGIEKSAGFRPEVILRTAADWAEVIAENPLARQAKDDPSRTLVTFLAGAPSDAGRAALIAAHKGPESLVFSGQELFLYYPDGAGRSKLTNVFIERYLGLPGTARNWNTVMKLHAVCESFTRA